MDRPLSKNVDRAIYYETDNLAPTWVSYDGSVDSHTEPLPRLGGVSQLNPLRIPAGTSLFEDMSISGFDYPPQHVWEATRLARRLILAHTSAMLQRISSEAMQVRSVLVQELSNELDARARNLDSEARRFTRESKHREKVDFICYHLNRHRLTLQQNKLTIDDVTKFSRPDNFDSSWSGRGDGSNHHDSGSEGTKGKQPEKIAADEMDAGAKRETKLALAYQQDRNDLREWREMERSTNFIDQMIQAAIDSYFRELSASHAYRSRVQASSYV